VYVAHAAAQLWTTWQQRHSPADIGRAAAAWLMVACAEQQDWQVGRQLLRYLGPTLLEVGGAVNQLLQLVQVQRGCDVM
jgi:hypothetical protein